MASTAHGASARMRWHVAGRRGMVDKYFYFAMSLLFAMIVVVGFSRTVKANLFHAAPPRPFLRWIHGVAFYAAAWLRRQREKNIDSQPSPSLAQEEEDPGLTEPEATPGSSEEAPPPPAIARKAQKSRILSNFIKLAEVGVPIF